VAEDSWQSPNHSSGAVTDIELEQLYMPFTANGVIGSPADTTVAYGDSSGMNVKIRSGKHASIRGFHWSAGVSDVTKTITSNASGSTRIDLLVLRLDRSTWDVRAAVVVGTPGSGAPAATQNTGTSGVWELPIAQVTVVNGAATITAGNVKQVCWYCGPQSVVCTSTTRPPATGAYGLQIYETDTGRQYVSNGTAFVTTIVDSGWVTVPSISGWNSFCVVRNLNGIGYLEGHFQRTGGPIGPNANWQLGTVPAGYRPDRQHRIAMVRSRGVAIIGWLNADGGVAVNEYDTAIGTNDLVMLQTTAYPIG
jgi:hypothetical protein